MKKVKLTFEETQQLGQALQSGKGSKFVMQLAAEHGFNPEKINIRLEVGEIYPYLQETP